MSKKRGNRFSLVQLHSRCFTNSSSKDGNLKKKNTHPMNKEITGLKNGDENPEAAAEEYIQKVTQRENWAGRVVNAKQRTEVVSSPRIGNDRRAGTLAEEGCGCHQRGGPTGWETQDGGSGCNWAMAKRTPGIFQPKPGPLNPRTPEGTGPQACGLKVPSS